MPDDRTVIDANVLVYALYCESKHFAASRKILDSAAEAEAKLCVTSQILAEFFSVVTNPKRVAQPRTPIEAIQVVESILALTGISVLPMPEDVPSRWVKLLRTRPAHGAAVFDIQLAATMQANGVHRIYTYNLADFSGVPDIEALTP